MLHKAENCRRNAQSGDNTVSFFIIIIFIFYSIFFFNTGPNDVRIVDKNNW